jgi:Mg/Co/Ni transporter MgtE
MEFDDLADLLAEMPAQKRTEVLEAMDDEDADVVRSLLSYAPGTAGALMTPDIIIMGANATVAEALAQVRDPDWLVSIAAQVYVVQPPFRAPTGTYLGVVHIQRLLREPPGTELGRCVSKEPTVAPNLSDREVAEFLASYNLLAAMRRAICWVQLLLTTFSTACCLPTGVSVDVRRRKHEEASRSLYAPSATSRWHSLRPRSIWCVQ